MAGVSRQNSLAQGNDKWRWKRNFTFYNMWYSYWANTNFS